MKLSIVIVNYNVKHFLEQCLLSVKEASEGIDAEIYVVDNHSSDGSVEMVREKFPEIHLIANTENIGFSGANNQALQLVTGEYVLLLNPDTVVEKETFRKCIAFMDRTEDAGGLGVKMVNGKGEFLPESKRGLPLPTVAFYKIFGFSRLFPKSRRFGSYHLTYLDENKIHAVDVLSGAFMLLRKSVLDKTGFLDEDYFMYGEDIDLSYRITQSGYKNYYYPETKIIHYKGESTKKGSLNYVFVFYRAMQIFARKHFSRKNAKSFNWMINFAIWFRAAFSILKRIVVALFPPILDFIVIFAGMMALSEYWEQTVLAPRSSSFPDEFRFVIIPIYILILILSIAFCSGYKKPIQLGNTNKGILLGTIIILLIYALLPERFRFSRAIIIFGAMWTAIALNSMRYIFHKTNFKNYSIGGKNNRRVVIIGNAEEARRVTSLIHFAHDKIRFLGTVTVQPKQTFSGMEIGSLPHLKTIISVFDIKEIVFCSKDIPISEIIGIMSRYQSHGIEFKIAPPFTHSVIGSNSILSPEDGPEYPFSLSRKENKRKKRVYDIGASLILAVFFVIDIWFVSHKISFLHNLFDVLRGNRSWVGYNYRSSENNIKPQIVKEGVLSAEDAFQEMLLDERIKCKIDQTYFQDYHIINDVKIMVKCFRDLGKRKI